MDLRKANAECGVRNAESSGSPSIPHSTFRIPHFSPLASSAITFTVPSSFASLPRTHSNGSPRTAVRCRSYTSGRTITFTIPSSSSSSTKMNPFAVSGRWRATTSPATPTHAPSARVHTVHRFRWKPQPHLPEELAPGEPEAVASPHPHEMLDRGALELGRGAPHEVADTAELTGTLPLSHHAGRRLFAPVAHEPEPHSHCIGMNRS